MTNLVIDWGNSRIKAARFVNSELKENFLLKDAEELHPLLVSQHNNLIVSSVSHNAAKILSVSKASGRKIHLTSTTPVPVNIKYATPETLGVDRIAAVCGALQLFPFENCLVIDMGTCINYELLDGEGNYWGGIISPGINMRFRAMHTFTARLPLFGATADIPLVGNSTQACMQSGVMNGVLEEMKGIVKRVGEQHPRLRVILCGGDAQLFENQLKDSIFAAPELVLVGLNRILNHNASI